MSAPKALVQQKATADRMRALPLPDVLDALGFQQDKAEPDRWKADGFNITLAQGPKLGKWFDHIAQHGRGGAIDLVQHITGADFKGALSWLADRFGEGATAADLTARMRAEAVRQVKEAKTEREPFTAPSPTPEHWPSAEILGGGSRPARALHRQAASAGRLLRRRPPQRRLHLQGR